MIPVELQESKRFQIRIRDLYKGFDRHPVLTGLDLDIERGKINIIIGGSGEGKSVLLRHIIGLLRPDSGHIFVDEEDLATLSDVELNRVRRKFGMLFQYAALFDSLTVEENVAFPLVEHTCLSWLEIQALVIGHLRQVGLENVEKKYPSEISGGMRKRVGLARALILKPQILLYDEPTTGLDPIATKNVDDMIQDISQATGVTSVVISHDMASTFRIADQVAMLYQGKIVASGSADEILMSDNEYVRAFVEMSGSVRMKHSAGAALIP